LFPPRDKSGPRYRLNKWLSAQQIIALWSQLLYTLALVVACVVRRHQNTIQGYEGGLILFVLGLTIGSTHLTLVAYLHRIKRWASFIAVVVSIATLGIYAQSSPALEQRRHWNVIRACLDKFSLKMPLNMRIPALVGVSVLMLLMTLAWFYLYRKIPDDGEISLVRCFDYHSAAATLVFTTNQYGRSTLKDGS
jgi:hypothetical protein